MSRLAVGVAGAVLGAIVLTAAVGTGQSAETVPPPLPAGFVESPDPYEPAARGDPEIRAQLTARKQTVLSSEQEGRIERLPRREGEAFVKGDVLVELDCSVDEARLERARAELEAARAKANVQKRLKTLNSTSTLEVQVAEAEVRKASAEMAVMQAKVDHCVIRAPFSGRVAGRTLQEHQYAKPGTEIMGILDPNDLEVELIVPSRWLTWMAPGAVFRVDIEEIGKSYPAKVARLGAAIDPVSQSIKVIGSIDGAFPDLLPGMSGRARFEEVR